MPATNSWPNWYILLFIVVVTPLKLELIDSVGPTIAEQLIVNPYPTSGLEVNGIILNPVSLEANPVGW